MKEDLLHDLAHLAPGDILSDLEGAFENPVHYIVVLERYADGGLELSVPATYPCITRLPRGPFYISTEAERFPLVDRNMNAVFYLGADACVIKGRQEGKRAAEAYARLLDLESSTPRCAEERDDTEEVYPYFSEMLIVCSLSTSERLENDVERSMAILKVFDSVPCEDRAALLSCIVGQVRGNVLSELFEKTEELERLVLNRVRRGKLMNGEFRSLRCHPLPKFMH